VIDDLLTGGFVAGQVKSPPVKMRSGSPDRGHGAVGRLANACLPSGALRAEDVAFAAASWALCVEYVDDLRRDPVDTRLHGIRDLPRLVRDACRELAGHLRDRQPGFYQRTADETEAWLTEELEAARAEELGASDTFRFEEDRSRAALGHWRTTWNAATIGRMAASRAIRFGSGRSARRSAWG
jgi:hypothetical protein